MLKMQNAQLLFLLTFILLPACWAAPEGAGTIYYDRHNRQTQTSGLWGIDPDSGDMRLVTPYQASNGRLSPDGNWLASSRAKDEVQTIWVVNTQTGESMQAGYDFRYAEIQWSTDNKLLLIEPPEEWTVLREGSPWVPGESRYVLFDPATGRSSPAQWHAPFVPPEDTVVYAPTLNCVAKSTYDRDPERGTLTVVCEGDEEPALSLMDELYGRPAWSADGRFLAFAVNANSQERWLSIWDRHNGSMRRVFIPEHAVSPRWSPDGEWISLNRDFTPCVLHVASKEVTCFEGVLGSGEWSPDSRSMVMATCNPTICEQLLCDCHGSWALITVSVPEGEVKVLRDDVAPVYQRPLWGQ